MARGYRRFSSADEDELWAWCGLVMRQADSSGVGVVDLGGTGIPGAVWRDPAGTQAPVAGPVEPG